MRKLTGALAGEIQHGVDGQREHRTLDEVAGLAAEHRFGFRVLAEQAAIDQRRRVFATPGDQCKAVLDQVACFAHVGCVVNRARYLDEKGTQLQKQKKSRARSPALKIVPTLFSRMFGFDLDGRDDAACARQGSSRDLDHQTTTFRLA
jgi:hypothetical protein